MLKTSPILILLCGLLSFQGALAQSRQTLFSENKALKLTLTANFSKDLSPSPEALELAIMGKEKYPSTKGKLLTTNEQGQPVELEVSLRLRGKDRARSCSFPPLKVKFSKKEAALRDTTPFKGLSSLKLATHCDRSDKFKTMKIKMDKMTPVEMELMIAAEIAKQDDLVVSPHALEQEYLAYKAYQQLTEQSFGIRRASITYVDSSTQKIMADKPAFFVEGEDDLAERLNLDPENIKEIKTPVNKENNARIQLFQTLMGNWDYDSTPLPHNVVALMDKSQRLVLIPYDFDRSASFQYSEFDLRGRYVRFQDVGCLNNQEQDKLFAEFDALSQNLTQEVKKNSVLSEKEKDTMVSFYQGYQNWLARLKASTHLLSCKN